VTCGGGRLGLGGYAHRFALLALAALFAAFSAIPGSRAQQRPGWIEDVRLFPATAEGDWAKRAWIEKAARVFRGGEGLGPDDDLDALMKLPEEEIARRFMRDARFGDAVLDFNLFMLGFKPDRLRGAHEGGRYSRIAFDFPNAVAAAQAVLAGGDYFKLFDFEGPFYMAPLSQEPEDPPTGGDVGLTAAQLRVKAVGELRQAFATVIAQGKAVARPNGDWYCLQVGTLVARKEALAKRVVRAFDDAEIFVLTRAQVIEAPFEPVAKVLAEECDGQPEQWVEIHLLVAALEAALAQYERAFGEILKHEYMRYRPRSVAEFRAFDLAAFPNTKAWLAFGHEQSIALGNSSTNLNRKRAAYVLKRFFCDDIVAAPPEPPQHGAAAESTCAACHAKLDPMAGFFRGHGAYFYDYGRSAAIVFDDLSTIERGRYEAAWRAPPGSGREWNIGYVRSTGATVYGSTLADLSRIARAAPESRRCLMKRLFEYMVAPDQMIDGGYLDHLAQEFSREAAVNSAEAFKNAMLRIAQSRAFRERNLVARQCYDYAPGAKPEEQPPCRIGYVLKKNCAGCHDSAESGDGNLDLGAWIKAPDGRSRTFPHLNKVWDQVTPEETLTKIVERLAARDPKLRMPKNRIMRADEREELMQWAQHELARLKQRGER
jgi:mono/diheme cytochrome c family protein